MTESIDPNEFRRVLGHFPTGVAAVTSFDEDGRPVGMAVGSFTSVSLSPPLVAFLPDKKSSTFPKIRQNGRFCANVLASRQESVCRSLAKPGDQKFDGVEWTQSANGMPRITDAVAWIDCEIDAVHDGGDHAIVVGRVLALEAEASSLPLLFFQGGYGRFAPLSFAAAEEPDIVEQLRLVELARPHMETLAQRTQAECMAAAIVGDEIVLTATAGSPAGQSLPTRVGQRFPLVPPFGTALVAWSEPATEAWFARALHPLSPADRQRLESMLDRVRERGWSIATGRDTHREIEGLLGQTATKGATENDIRNLRELIDRLEDAYEPAESDLDGSDGQVRNVTVPVFDRTGNAAMVLSLYGLPTPTGRAGLDSHMKYVEAAMEAAEQVSTALRNASPSEPEEKVPQDEVVTSPR